MTDLLALSLVGVALAFAWSMGAHYTGACMGVPYGAGAIRLVPALLLMAPLTLLGAALVSGRVELTVGRSILPVASITLAAALGIVATAFALTTAFNALKIPTSTIQILVFAIVGTGLALGVPVAWNTIGTLAALWAAAPLVCVVLGYGFTRTIDHFLEPRRLVGRPAFLLGSLLVAVGGAASVAMGGNDVANATGVFVLTQLTSPLVAGAVGGVGLAIGVLTWGKPLLRTVAFDVVKMDRSMAAAAQSVQALVILTAVFLGYFTSMNQALVGALAGTGLARGRRTVNWRTVRGILVGWAVGPLSSLALGFGIASLLHLTGFP